MQKHTTTSGCQSASPEILRSDSRLTRLRFLHLSCFLILIVLFFLNACSSDLENLEGEDMMVGDVESVGFSAMRPFEAWMMTPSTGSRSMNSEIAELIAYEKESFYERFSFVKKFFNFVPTPQWESAKVVSYNEEETDVFILCNNDFPDNVILNKLILVITIRGNDRFSFIKMLPKDEYLAVWMTAVNDGENVHIEVHQREPDGIFISQRVGYLTIDSLDENVRTRMIDCSYELIQNTQQTLMTYGDREYGVINDVDDYVRFYCDDYGSSGGVYAPPPSTGGGSIPGYTPPSFPSPGTSGGSTSSGESGGSSYSGGASYYGGAGSVGGGDPSLGGSVGGGGSSSDNSTPEFPKGGLDIIPRPEYMRDPQPEVHPLIRSHTLSTYQLDLLLKAFNDLQVEGCLQKALYDALIERNVKLDFGMKTGTAPGAYDPRTKKISFNQDESITSANLKEELFHAWQDVYYQNGIEQYGKDGQGIKLPGYVNIEFEAKVFSDIFNNPQFGCCYVFRPLVDTLPEDLYREYTNWAYDIQEKKIPMQDVDYQYWLQLFNQHSPEYSSPMLESLSTPRAIRELLAQSDCE